MAVPRKTRRDKDTRQLSPRDLWVLPWIGSMYAIRFDQLQALLSREPGQRNKKAPGPQGISDSAVDQVIERWEEPPALVVYDRIYRKDPGWIWLTACAERELMLPYRRHHLRQGTLPHKYAVNAVRLDYERRHPDVIWKSERMIRAALPRRARGERVPPIPDGEIWKEGERFYAIEVELSPKSDEEIDAHLREMLSEPDSFQAVWYFVSNADATSTQAWRVVEAARARLPEDLQRHMQIIDLAKVGGTRATAADAAHPTE